MKKYIVYAKENGKIETDFYRKVKRLTKHREDGPAMQSFNSDGQLAYESYWVNGKWHRLDGPARIYYKKDGKLLQKLYYINNKEYNKSEYDVEIFKMKLALL